MSNSSARSEPKTTDNMEINRTRHAQTTTPTSISLDTGRNSGSRPRAKVNQALAIAATINSQADMKSGSAPTSHLLRSASAKQSGGGANSQSQSQMGMCSATGEDYESSKAADKGGKQKRDHAAEERRMVADLDRFDANDDHDNLEDSF